MAAMRCRSRFDADKVKRKVNQGTFKSLNHAAAAILALLAAIGSIIASVMR